MLDRFVGACLRILLAVLALYCAVALIKSILPALTVIIGVLAITAGVIKAIVVISTWQNRW